MAYLGQTIVEQKDTEFKDFGPAQWAIYFIEEYGQYDGGHHKQWVMDQVVRILKGSEVIINLAKWDNNPDEYRVSVGEPSLLYLEWVNEMQGVDGEDSDFYCEYDYGIAP